MGKNRFSDNEKVQRKMEEFNISKDSNWQGDIVSKFILDLSKKYLSKKNLDVGAGTGALVSLISKKNYSAVGLDLCPKRSFIKTWFN